MSVRSRRPAQQFVRRRTVAFPLLIVLAVLTSACGTRLSHQEVETQLQSAYGVPRSGAVDSANATTGADLAPGVSADGDAQPRSGASPGDGPGAAGTESVAESSSDSGNEAAGQQTPAGGGSGAPIVIGMDGAWSGIAGGVFAPSRDAVRAWARTVNDRGGINGHPVELIVTDNAFNASRALANVRALVEEHHAIALVNLVAPPGALEPIARYVEGRNIPVIVSNGDYAVESPALFAVNSNADVQAFGMAQAFVDAGINDIGAVYCVESTSCADLHDLWRGHAESLGLNIVYDARVSTAQPDYTSTCVQARSNGAAGFMPVLDGFGTVRLIESCVRQNYRPLFVHITPSGEDAASLPDGTTTPLRSFPWFLTSGTPALDEYGGALDRYVDNAVGQYSSTGWIAGKAVERALAAVSETPVPEDVFNGLWSFRDETLGGLIPPVSFSREGNEYAIRCSYQAVVQGGVWTAPLGLQPTYCMP